MSIKDAYRLFHRGSLALAEVSLNGFPVDTDYLEKEREALGEDIEEYEEELEETELGKKWRELHSKPNYNSGPQTSDVLYGRKGFREKVVHTTSHGKPSTSANALKVMDIEGIDLFLDLQSAKKTLTFLDQLWREKVNGRVHPSYSLNIPRSFRSASSNPNFQNMPVRDEDAAASVREAIIPADEGWMIGEMDYGQLEVRIAACYHQDPTMLSYIENPSKDMHRDMAMRIFQLKKDQVTKNARYLAKNRFVFPAFYGSYWANIAPNLWKGIDELDLKCGSKSMRQHLRSKEIKTYQDFERHIKKEERRFWEKQFPVYTEWKDRWWKEYCKKGEFHSLTGFRYTGPMSRRQVINYPVQGAAFHCLLWSLIEAQLATQKMESHIIGQIHDSILWLFKESELQDVLNIVYNIAVHKLVEEWDWICVPLEVDVEVSPPGQSWFHKQEWDHAGGIWQPKEEGVTA